MSRHLPSLFIVSAALFSMTLFSGCSESHKTAAPAPPVVKGIATTTLAPSELPETLEVVGTIRARTSAMVSARIAGTVNVLQAREGDRVAKGQLLARLDAQENTAQATAALAAIDEAKRGLEEAQTQRKLADATFARFKALYDEQALTRQEFETHQAQRELAHQGVARAEARLRQVQQTARAAGTMADYTKIIAPISGIITAKQADLGATVFPGQPLMTIEDEGSYQLELAVPESYAAKVRPGATVQITLDVLQKTFPAKVAELVPAADPGSRTFTAKVNLGMKGLKSGMFGRGSIALGGMSTALLVPKAAVFERGALTAVWVVDSNNIARMRLVKIGKTIADRVEILSGLSAGERIVLTEVAKVSEGAKLEP